ncbi:hypothetical protein ECG_08772 [Echinococcus granulosus]|uniref:DUF5753 domain-containing protein n=1 Tax=Echinococcus granulosus TaxID=6210 RepID=A0A068WTZ8_ECHGR|nr:hypothetical protein ECG_08772 [Echinococcus granulosus]CDS23638.1 hypothetical protein EgrG_002044200 [Echinococcus granulosus]
MGPGHSPCTSLGGLAFRAMPIAQTPSLRRIDILPEYCVFFRLQGVPGRYTNAADPEMLSLLLLSHP